MSGCGEVQCGNLFDSVCVRVLTSVCQSGKANRVVVEGGGEVQRGPPARGDIALIH